MARRRTAAWTRPLASAQRSAGRLTRQVLNTLGRQSRQATRAATQAAFDAAARGTRRAQAEATRIARRAAAQAARKIAAAARAQARRTAALAQDGRWLAGLVPVPGGVCPYRLFLPAAAAARHRVPLVVMLHGCQQDAEGFAYATAMNRVAARAGFAVLYPEQDRLANAQGCWNWFDTRHGRAERELASVLAAVAQVGVVYPVEVLRFGLAGLSAGASLAALLAVRHPERVAAVAMHAGVAPGAATSSATALRAMRGHGREPEPPPPGALPWPPLLVLQGDADLVVSPRNAEQAARLWAAAAGGCRHSEREVQRGRRRAMTVIDHVAPGRRLVCRELHVAGLGHAWSGGLRGEPFCDPQGPDASRLIWAWIAAALARVPRGDPAGREALSYMRSRKAADRQASPHPATLPSTLSGRAAVPAYTGLTTNGRPRIRAARLERTPA